MKAIAVLVSVLIVTLAGVASPVMAGPRVLDAEGRSLDAREKPRNAAVNAASDMCFQMTAAPWLPLDPAGNQQEQSSGPMPCAQCEQLIAARPGVLHSCDDQGNCTDIPVARRCAPAGTVPTEWTGPLDPGPGPVASPSRK